MADFLAIARDMDARLQAADVEPFGERLVQGISRAAGVIAFVAALGGLVYWLIG